VHGLRGGLGQALLGRHVGELGERVQGAVRLRQRFVVPCRAMADMPPGQVLDVWW
jgi:hypothetical protein